MIYKHRGPFRFTKEVLGNWNSNIIGVYYLGALNTEKNLVPYYIGRSTAETGIRGRLQDHLGEWSDVTHFGFEECDTVNETENHESNEIKKYQPRYNKINS